MAQYQESAKIEHVEHLAHDICRISVASPRIANASTPGQFVMVRAGNGYDPLLRRPFSIHSASNGRLQILFKIVGRGTALLSKMKQGQNIEIFGPLGKGFALPADGHLVMVGGGMGIAPLRYAAEKISVRGHDASNVTVLLGARNKQELEPLARDFVSLGCGTELATDDGSLGHHGFVIDLLQRDFVVSRTHCQVIACGPYPMMKAVAKICREQQWRCQVSLETLMACGMGACLGCAIPPAELSGNYLHVCKEGPVFDSEEIAWL